MARVKITGLPILAAMAVGDLLCAVSDPGGSPVTKKITVDAFFGSIPVATKITDATAAMISDSGALQVVGGVGIGGSIYANGGMISARDGVSDSAKLMADGGGGWIQFYQSGTIYSIGQRAGGGVGLDVRAGGMVGGTSLFSVSGTALASGTVSVKYTTASADAVTGSLVVAGGVGITGRLNTTGTISTGDTIYTTHQINIGGAAASNAIRAYRANANGGGWQVDLINAKPSMWLLNSSGTKLLKIGLTNQNLGGGENLVIGYGTGDPSSGDDGIVMANGGQVTIRNSNLYGNLTLAVAEGGAPTGDKVYQAFQAGAAPGVGNAYGILSSYIARGGGADRNIGRLGFRTGAAWIGGTYDSVFVVRTLLAGVAADRFTIAGDVATMNGDLNIVTGDAVLDSDKAVYLGSKTVDGSWRMARSGTDLVLQRRESSVWATKQTITA